MSLNLNQLLAVHEDMLKYHISNAEVLASNIANVDMPNYQARGLSFADYVKQVEDQISGSGITPEPSSDLKYRIAEQPSQDGNTVDIGQAQARFSENAMDYRTSYSFLNLQLKGIKEAIDGQAG